MGPCYLDCRHGRHSLKIAHRHIGACLWTEPNPLLALSLAADAGGAEVPEGKKQASQEAYRNHARLRDRTTHWTPMRHEGEGALEQSTLGGPCRQALLPKFHVFHLHSTRFATPRGRLGQLLQCSLLAWPGHNPNTAGSSCI